MDRGKSVHSLSLPANEADHENLLNTKDTKYTKALFLNPSRLLCPSWLQFFTFGSLHLSSTYSGQGHRP
jgi:hypothetical protein